MTPDRVRQAAQRARELAGPLPFAPAAGEPGDLAVASERAGTAKTSHVLGIVAVVGSDDSTKTVTIQLATNEVEQSTDLDLILSSSDVGIPFAIAVQSELYGPLFLDQLRATLGRLERGQLDAVREALLTDGESLEGFSTGAPLLGLDDPRRAFKQNELTKLEHLVSECRAWLTGEAALDTVPDPLLFVPPPAGTPPEIAEDRFLELLDAVEPLGPGSMMLPSEFVASSGEFLAELLRWREDFGLDVSRVLTRIQITELPTGLTEVSKSTNSEFTTDDSSAVLKAYLTDCASLGKATVDIHSVARCWGDRKVVIIAEDESRYCRGRAVLLEAA